MTWCRMEKAVHPTGRFRGRTQPEQRGEGGRQVGRRCAAAVGHEAGLQARPQKDGQLRLHLGTTTSTVMSYLFRIICV
jgi:hypothetical protein